MRLIDADDLVNRISASPRKKGNPLDEMFFNALFWEVAISPTIEAEPVRRGRWEDIDYLFSKCSVCECIVDTLNNAANYCPNCGAKMEEEG